MPADQAAGEEILALRGRVPHSADAHQLSIVVVAVVEALLVGRWFSTVWTLYHRDSNDHVVAIPYERERGGAACGLPLVFAGEFAPCNGLCISR